MLKPPNHDDRCIKRRARTIPFGYKAHDNDTDWLVPIQKELELLEQAKEYCKTCPLREVAAWLTAKSGRNISHMGLKKIIDGRSQRYSATKTA